MRIYRGLLKFRGESALDTWVYRLTVNAALHCLLRTLAGAETAPTAGVVRLYRERDDVAQLFEAMLDFDEAMQALDQGDTAAAMTNVKLALMHDPNNPKYRAKLEEMKKTSGGASSKQ